MAGAPDDKQPRWIEVGAKAIYAFRSHPRKAPWTKTALETRKAYCTRMQEVANELAVSGYEIVRREKRR